MRSPKLIIIVLILACSCVHSPKLTKPSSENPYYTLAFKFRNEGISDSAFFYYNRAKDLFQENGDSLGIGKCLINMAIISTDHGDYFGGQELSLDAIPYFNEDSLSHHVYQESNFNNLGIASKYLKQFDKAINFYKAALQVSSDSADALVIRNNIAHAYQSKGDYVRALLIYQEILPKIKSKINYARVLSNLAYTKWLQQPKRKIVGELQAALAIRKQENDLWGQCASEGYLSDYYLQSQPDSARYFAQQMLTHATQLNSPDDQIQALKKLVKLSQTQDSRAYFEDYQALKDSLETERNAARNQFALIRYETEKYKAESTQKAFQINRQQNWMIILVITFCAFIGLGWLGYHNREKRLALQAENTIKEHQLKTSRKVHDVIANGLYRILSTLEHQPEMDTQQMLDDIEVLYEKSRAISHEEEDLFLSMENSHYTLPTMLHQFSNEQTKVMIEGFNDEKWNSLSAHQQTQIRYILQELMVNMKKHSQAKEVILTFNFLQGEVLIQYVDDGVGLMKDLKYGKGLSSTENRIQDLNGRINFEANLPHGLKVGMRIPTT